METQVRKRSLRTAKCEELRQDLLSFREKALELGASAAEIIPASYVVVQERVWLKCLVPRCHGAGQNPYCPPNNPQPDFIRKVFSQYQWAVVFKWEMEPIEDYIPTSETHRKEIESRLPELGFYHRKTCEITGRLESYAQSKGYDLAMGFGGGRCNTELCANEPCAVLQGNSCRHPLRARPAPEAVGIDVFDLASKVGWDAYLIRRMESNLSEIPCALSIGIVFIY